MTRTRVEIDYQALSAGKTASANCLENFTDIRELQRQLKQQGVQFLSEAEEDTKGPASFIAIDPDGNPVLVDQHV